MKKIYFGVLSSLILALTGLFGQNTFASVNDFRISDFTADYYLGKDNSGFSTLKTVEKITAVFPESDQNHGIERFLPGRYDNHNIGLNVISVKDESGNDIEYSSKSSGGGVVLRIGSGSTYVHGSKTYVISYTARNVTKSFESSSSDEFYWDIQGTAWTQPFDLTDVKIHLESSLVDSLTGNMSCYYGFNGENNKCEINKNGDVISTTLANLKVGESQTVAIGFKPGTFKPYENTVVENITIYANTVAYLVGIFGLLAATYVVAKNRSAKSSHAIVPEYLPPKDIDVMQAALVGSYGSWIGATYIDLAVRHKIKIIELEKKMFQKPNYRFELITLEGLTTYEKDILISLFGENAVPGSEYVFKPNSLSNTYLARRIDSVHSRAQSNINKSDYYKLDKKFNKLKVIATSCAFISVIAQFILIGIDSTGQMSDYRVFSIIIFIIVVSLIASNKPLSQKGRDLKDYLLGLKMYIKVGEQERIRILQSPQGAEKTPIDTNNKESLVHLYERVLPYAVLFSLEKQWSKVLETEYTDQNIQPLWYSGVNGFNMANFQSGISNFSSSSAVSSSSYSSSGGSTGGGSVGGGGGGGGGGGW